MDHLPLFDPLGGRGPPGAALFQTAWFVESLPDADADCAHHPDEPDSIHPEEFAELAVVFEHPLTIMAVWSWLPYSPLAHFSRVRAAAGVLVVVVRIVFAFLLGALPSCEGVVLQKIWRRLSKELTSRA